MWSKTFWLAAGERAVGAFLLAIATVVADAGGNLATVDWPTALGIAGGAVVLSLAASATKARVPLGDPGAPSLVPTGRHAKPE